MASKLGFGTLMTLCTSGGVLIGALISSVYNKNQTIKTMEERKKENFTITMTPEAVKTIENHNNNIT